VSDSTRSEGDSVEREVSGYDAPAEMTTVQLLRRASSLLTIAPPALLGGSSEALAADRKFIEEVRAIAAELRVRAVAMENGRLTPNASDRIPR
jgi:hypothetical protein